MILVYVALQCDEAYKKTVKLECRIKLPNQIVHRDTAQNASVACWALMFSPSFKQMFVLVISRLGRL